MPEEFALKQSGKSQPGLLGPNNTFARHSSGLALLLFLRRCLVAKTGLLAPSSLYSFKAHLKKSTSMVLFASSRFSLRVCLRNISREFDQVADSFRRFESATCRGTLRPVPSSRVRPTHTFIRSIARCRNSLLYLCLFFRSTLRLLFSQGVHHNLVSL